METNIGNMGTKGGLSVVAKSFVDARRITAINQAANITRTLVSHKVAFDVTYHGLGVLFTLETANIPETLLNSFVVGKYATLTGRDHLTEIWLTW